MTRPLRIELAGGVYHVTARGDRREDIYFGDDDRQAWLDLLGLVCERFNWVCHGWCQMTNHYHLIVETPDGNLAQGMRQLNGVYTQAINRKYNRVGHVYQGRYKAILVEKDSYLLELARYVVLNPIRAGMVSDVGDWAWSSYRAMIGLTTPVAWLQTDWLLAQFSTERRKAILGYIDFVRAGVGLPSVWDNLKGQIYLGSDVFVSKMAALSDQSIGEIPRAQRRPLAKPLAEYGAGTNRKDAIRAAYASGDYTMQEIALYFGVHYSTVSRAVNAAGE